MLQSERLLLREFRDEDFDAVHAYGSDSEVVRYMPWGPNSEEESRDFLARAQAYSKAEPQVGYEFAVTRRDTGELIGGMGFHVDGSSAMLGYCFAKSAWGNGFATEAARLVLDFGFGEQGVHRVWAGCDPDNAGSIRVLEKLGMTQEGRLRQDTYIRGAWRDTLLFAVLAHEWHEAQTREQIPR